MIVLRPSRLALIAPLGLVSLPGVAYAESDIRVSAEARADVGYSANPFSVSTGDTGTASATLAIAPKVKLVNERSVFTLSASAEYLHYFERYGDVGNYDVGLDYTGTPVEHIKTHFNVRYDSAIIGGNTQVFGVVDPTLPTLPVTSGTDLSLFGTRDRRETLRGTGDVTVELSARDSLLVSGFYVRSRYGQFAALGNNDGYGGSVGYSRVVSEHLRLGVQGSAAQYNYGGALGDSRIYSVQGAFSATLSARWKADGAVGVSFVERSAFGNSTTFSGNLRLCNTTTRANFCLNASRAVLPTGISGTQNETAVDASYSYRITEHGSIFGTVGYTTNANNQLNVSSQNEYFRASLGYEHVLRRNLRLVVGSQYRKILGGLAVSGADYGGQVGVRVSFGDPR